MAPSRGAVGGVDVVGVVRRMVWLGWFGARNGVLTGDLAGWGVVVPEGWMGTVPSAVARFNGSSVVGWSGWASSADRLAMQHVSLMSRQIAFLRSTDGSRASRLRSDGRGRMVTVGIVLGVEHLQRPLVWGGQGGRTRTILGDQRLPELEHPKLNAP